MPSRPFFPRGFLWDDGFHQLLVGVWKPAIANDVLAHWMHLMHSDGWIPREQILGAEAQARVPAEFMPQHRQHANPPTLMLRLERLLNGGAEQGGEEEWLPLARRLWPRLTRWYGWLVRTQAGELPHTFRWRGRDAADNRLNALTLSSGLDDYPRATVPTKKSITLSLTLSPTLSLTLTLTQEPNPNPNLNPNLNPNPNPNPSPNPSPYPNPNPNPTSD